MQTIATRWELRTRTLQFGRLPAIMGIVNVTPDSFSDGGKFFTPDLAVQHALQLAAAGADILDIGGESTRPFSATVSVDDELDRVMPVIQALRGQVSIPISIDTSKSEVAQAAIEAGAEIINDVTGLSGDPNMVHIAAEAGVGVCAMHMQGTPKTMQNNPTYENLLVEITDYLASRDAQLISAGIAPQRVCLDPGIGFGKTHEHNLELVRYAERFLQLGRPILIGHSRKAFIGKLIGDSASDRTAGTLGLSLALASKGIQVLRVHDVKSTREALQCFFAAHDHATASEYLEARAQS
ncbi:MAG: dihydropteroate synthase [Pirellulaceae bacterium]